MELRRLAFSIRDELRGGGGLKMFKSKWGWPGGWRGEGFESATWQCSPRTHNNSSSAAAGGRIRMDSSDPGEKSVAGIRVRNGWPASR